jgi:hypothetical protein
MKGNPSMADTLIWVYLLQGKLVEAEALLNQYREDPRFRKDVYLLRQGYLQMFKGDLAGAQALAEEILGTTAPEETQDGAKDLLEEVKARLDVAP